MFFNKSRGWADHTLHPDELLTYQIAIFQLSGPEGCPLIFQECFICIAEGKFIATPNCAA